MNKRLFEILAVACALAIVAFITVGFSRGFLITKGEREAEFLEWYAENQPSEQERQAEFQQRYDSVRPDDEKIYADFLENLERYEASVSGPSEAAIKEEITRRARRVYTEVVLRQTLREAIELLDLTKRFNDSREEGQPPIALEDILGDDALKQEAIGMLPPDTKVFENDMVHLQLPARVWGFDSEAIPSSIGYLGRDSVIAPSEVQEAICRGTPLKDAELFLVTVSLLPNTEREDFWKSEVLFKGTALELCNRGASSPELHEDKFITVYQRPKTKLFFLSDEDIFVGDIDALELGSKLYFARATGSGGMELGIGFFDGRLDNSLGLKVARFLGRINPSTDSGTALYYVNGSNEIRMVGFISSSGPFAIGAEFTLSGLDDFPHIVEDSTAQD